MSRIWIKTNYVPHSRKEHIIQGKWYLVEIRRGTVDPVVDITSELGLRLTCRPSSCLHLDGHQWIVHYGDTPPVGNNWLVEEVKAAKNNVLHWPEWIKDAVKHSTAYSVCKLEDRPTQWAEVYPKTSSELPVSNDQVVSGSKVAGKGRDVSTNFIDTLADVGESYRVIQETFRVVRFRGLGADFDQLLSGLKSGRYTIIDNEQGESNNEDK